jgi:hypothetical protein
MLQAKFDGYCILYADLTWKPDGNTFYATYGAKASCQFPLYISVFAGVIYAAIVGAFHIYAFCKKDPNFG